MQDIGYFVMWRELFKKPIWTNSTPEQCKILITILGMVNFVENEWEWGGEKFQLQPGQTVTSLETIKTNCGKGISIQNVRTSLVRFEKLQFLTNESTKTGRLLTVLNWRLYQTERIKANIVTNKDLTKTSQRPNKDLTPIEEGNNEKKVNNEINKPISEEIVKKEKPKKNKINIDKPEFAEYVHMTNEEYNKLNETYGELQTKAMITILDNYKGSSGKQYKDDYRAILSWVVKRYSEDLTKSKPEQQTIYERYPGIKL